MPVIITLLLLAVQAQSQCDPAKENLWQFCSWLDGGDFVSNDIGTQADTDYWNNTYDPALTSSAYCRDICA